MITINEKQIKTLAYRLSKQAGTPLNQVHAEIASAFGLASWNALSAKLKSEEAQPKAPETGPLNPFVTHVIEAASQEYPEGRILEAYDANTGTFRSVGDGLAEFIAREIAEVCSDCETQDQAFAVAAAALDTVAREVLNAKEGLDSYLTELPTFNLHFCQLSGDYWTTDQINENPKALLQRVDPGEPMPSGESNVTGALTQEVSLTDPNGALGRAIRIATRFHEDTSQYACIRETSEPNQWLVVAHEDTDSVDADETLQVLVTRNTPPYEMLAKKIESLLPASPKSREGHYPELPVEELTTADGTKIQSLQRLSDGGFSAFLANEQIALDPDIQELELIAIYNILAQA